MPRSMRKRSQKAGLPPGTLVYTGEKSHEPPRITLIDYDETHCEELELPTLEECLPYRRKPTVTWINVSGISHVASLEKLGECFNLHPLVLEDILNIDQRPKVEDYEDYLYIVLKTIIFGARPDEVSAEQISLILGSNYVISLHETDGDIFAPVRERLLTAKGRIRKSGADYLAYSLIDLIVDNYFVVLEKFGDQVEFLEEELVSQPTPKTLHAVHRFKNDMIILRKSLWPLREVIGRLERRESPLISDSLTLYFKDVYDHAVIAIDTVETYRDILAGMLDIYLSSISNRLNEIMKVLTIIATIFMPLTFITGVYGMNFDLLFPDKKWSYGFFSIVGGMALVALLMLYYFKRRKWI